MIILFSFHLIKGSSRETSQELRMIVAVTLYSGVPMNVEIAVLNCQKRNQCLKGHKSLSLSECCMVVFFKDDSQ